MSETAEHGPALLLTEHAGHDRSEAQPGETEERYRRLVELSPDAIVVHKQGKIVFANPAAARLVGAERPSDILGKPVLDFVHPDSRPAVISRLGRLQEGKSAPLLDERFVRLDGTPVEVEVAAKPFVHGGEVAVQVVVREVTDRKKAEDVLRHRNQYLAALHETTLGLIDRLDLRESLQAIVARAAALVGTEHGYIYLVEPGGEEIEVKVGLGAFAQWVGYRMRRGEGMAGRVWLSGEPVIVDDYDTWDGRSRGFAKGVFKAVIGLPLKSGPEVIGIIGLAHVEAGRGFDTESVEVLNRFGNLASIAFDNARLYTAAQTELAERTRVEVQLRQAEAKYRTLVEQIPAITYTVESGKTWLYVSPQVEHILGFTPDEWMAEPSLWAERVHRDDRPATLAARERIERTGGPLSCEYRLVARDGRTVWVHDEVVVVSAVSGRPVLHGVMFDITERKRAEEELERALGIEREASERLRLLDEMKNTFLHAVSHELRTPLSAVLGFALTLDRDEVELRPEERQDIVRRLAANARKLDQLLSDLLDLDRLARGIMEPRRRPSDIAALVRRTVEGSDILGVRDVRVEAELAILSIDAPKVERIVENLLANAIRHTPPEARIWVRVLPGEEGVVIAVEDDGPGVERADRELVFEPFRRGPNAPAHAPGVGIGLSLVARFAQLHGGRAWVEPRQGGGASFRVFLPGVPG